MQYFKVVMASFFFFFLLFFFIAGEPRSTVNKMVAPLVLFADWWFVCGKGRRKRHDTGSASIFLSSLCPPTSVFIRSLASSSLFKKKITSSLFIIPANLDRSPGQRQITLSRISNLINLQPLEGITLPMNNYSNPVMSCQCQNVATTIF